MVEDADFMKLATIAGRYAELCGKLEALVGWCVDHEGETLTDNPGVLEIAKRVLAEARAQMGGRSNGQ